MRILMISGAPGKEEGGVAGIVHNLARELGNLGHSAKRVRHYQHSCPLRLLVRRAETVAWLAGGSSIRHDHARSGRTSQLRDGQGSEEGSRRLFSVEESYL